jgi:FkbH-like protein
MGQQALFRKASALARAAQPEKALRLLGDAIRRGQLSAEDIDKAGERCKSLFEQSGVKSTCRILLLGQCTTTWLSSALRAMAWGDGRVVDVVEGAYDNVMQELLAAPSDGRRVDVVVLVPWNQRLLSGASRTALSDRVVDECSFWEQAWGMIEGRLGARVVQVGYDWVTAGPMGYGLASKGDGDVARIRAVNQQLRDTLPAGGCFIDLEHVSADLGRTRFYDPRRYYWTKQPFSEEGTVRLAQHISAATRAVMTGPKKVLVLDLDNTLWGGLVGETGPLGITLGDGPDGEAFSAFQKHVKRLSERGIVLAVCSKNNDADAREPFETNPNMHLSLDDFAQFEATWGPKADAIRRVAKTLQLGLDSFVFVDDNPAEREQVRQSLPEVGIVDLPEDPAEYIRVLDSGLWFEAVEITNEDRVRVEQYRSERRRRDAEVTFETLDGYLKSLEMRGDIRPIDEADMDRVVQLIGKTNQFNLTTRRHGPARVRQMLEMPDTVALTLRLGDRFGDHGLVAVIIAVPDTTSARPTFRIDSCLMSCRVINRTAEQFLFNALVSRAKAMGARRLIGEYIATSKNALVKDLYDRLGFERLEGNGSEGVEYELDLSLHRPLKTFVKPKRQPAQVG